MADTIKLLIVDDEVKFLNAIATRLELRGFVVTKATNGREALDAAKTGRFDLALVDLKMPGASGEEVLQALKAEHRFLEVIILTGHGSVDSAVTCTKLGAFGYLPKPYDFEELLKVLAEAYQHRLERKFERDRARIEELQRMVLGESPAGLLRKMSALDDDEK
jgi:DNA-binding NtrC family response regulator